MWEVFSRQDRDEVLCWSSKDTYGRGNFGGGVRGVPVLKDGFLESIDVDCTIFPDVAGDQPFDGFDAHLSSAVAVREYHGAKAVVYPPVVQTLPGGVGYELGATI